MKLNSINVGGLDRPARSPDLRRDIHVFVDYVRNREVKRSHRGNLLSKADAKRLAALLSDPQAVQEVATDDGSDWLDYIDDLVLDLGFVAYDTEGVYAGYTSSAPSFPENYIRFVDKVYQAFVNLSAAQQEAKLLGRLLSRNQGSRSEFFRATLLGRLDKFSPFGSAVGVMPTLDFAAARRFLLELLAECPPGEWFSTASLVEHLKKHHRYFLIPEKPKFKTEYDARQGRYGNFHESKGPWSEGTPVPVKDPDSFERVEGRYVERFLEDIPWTLRYVDVAFRKQHQQAVYPSRGTLEAFRVSELLRRALRGQIAEPRVTVTPSFDVYVQPEIYPAKTLSLLAPLCEIVKEDTSWTLKITKQNVAAACAADSKLDVAALLRKLTENELPANVLRELAAWSEHGEKFVLYSGVSLLEADKGLSLDAAFTVESLAPGVHLIRSPDKLFGELERQEHMPLRVKHADAGLTALPRHARTRFPKQAAVVKQPRPAKPQLKLMRVTRVQLVSPSQPFFDELLRLLVEAKCPVEADREKRLLSYARTNEPQVSAAIRALQTRYQVKIEDLA